jgi:CheY-like chemotaxis protein
MRQRPADRKPAAAAPGRTGPRRVLVVDDNSDAADTLRDLLELSGHAAAVARDGAEALELAEAFAPDVILCDIGLPGMDGYAVARAVRRNAALDGVLLVALTGYALPDDLRRAAEAGFDLHLAKPPPLERIEAILRSGGPRGPPPHPCAEAPGLAHP